jgi:hypothetical protein
MTLVDFEEFKRTILNPLFEEPAMKTYCFTIKDGDGDLFSFELESDKTLEEVVKSKEFVEKLEENSFFYEDANYENLDSLEWTCFSFQAGAKGFTKEDTFDIGFSSEKIWKVD